MTDYRLATQCIQAGYHAASGEPLVLPIVQSTTFKYDNCETMGKLFDLEAEGYFYSRLANPTCDAVAAKINTLEGGVAAILTASGQAASFYAVFNLCRAGDHVVASAALYGGTFNLFNVTMRRMGIDFTFVDPAAGQEELDAAFRPETKAVFAETLSNPSLVVLDIERFADAAHRHGVPLIIDNTFPTPINCRPLEWGADIVVHSTTKYMDGHATSVGGVIVDGGRFNWETQAARYPELTTPDASYHGITYTKQFGQAAYYAKLLAQLMRDLGASPAPQNAFLLNLGLETLALRMAKHCENAQKAAEFFAARDEVSWVIYPGLPGDAGHDLAQKYLPDGSCGVVAIGLKGGRESAMKFMSALKLGAIATHVADIRTCLLHPASTTHRQLSEDELRACGIGSELVRISCGCEDSGDLIEDFTQALEKL